MTRVRGSLARVLPQTAADDDDLFRLAQAAWRKRGVATIRTDEIHNDWERKIVENIANRLYGRRNLDTGRD